MSYEVYAIRYARHDRPARENFLDDDPHDGPMPLDYFVWAIVGAGRTFVVDTGFGADGGDGAQARADPLAGRRARARSASIPRRSRT